MQKLISSSFERMKALLFPFNLNHWLNILFVIWLAGAAGGSGGGTGGFENLGKLKNLQPQKPVPVAVDPTTLLAGSGVPGAIDSMLKATPKNSTLDPSQALQTTSATPASRASQLKTEVTAKIKKFWPWVLAGTLLIGIPFMLLMSWLSARFNFILIEFLVQKNLTIRRSFTQNRDLGNSLFKFNLFFLAGSILLLGCMIGLFFLGKVGIIFGALGFLTVVLGMIAVAIGMNDFIMPLMYHRKLSAGQAARLFWEQDFEWGKIFLYYLVKIGLGIVSSVVLGICALIVGMAVFIPAGIIVALLVWLVKMKLLLSIILAVLAVIAVIILIVAVSLAALPFHIFFQCFRLGFVGHLLPQFSFFEESEGILSIQT